MEIYYDKNFRTLSRDMKKLCVRESLEESEPEPSVFLCEREHCHFVWSKNIARLCDKTQRHARQQLLPFAIALMKYNGEIMSWRA